MPKRDATRSMSLTSQESYSAVIIADMVAEIPTDPEEMQANINRKSSTASAKRNGSMRSKSKDQTNMGYEIERKDSSPPAVVDVELVEASVHGQSKQNGSTDISRGVILNATQFGASDIKLTQDSLKSGKALEMSKVPIPDNQAGAKGALAELADDFSQMSLPRKIAFGFSFLPSIMFVLCFAVILPCKEPVPCVQELWLRTLNNTMVTSDLVIPGNIIYTYVTKGNSFIGSIDDASGTVFWNRALDSEAHHVECGLLEDKNSEACLVMEDRGTLRLFNASNSVNLWERNLNEREVVPSAPTILSDCNEDGIAEIGLAVSKGQIKVLMNGIILFTVNVTACDSVPSKMTSWHRINETDIVFTCLQGSEEKLMKIPKTVWCPSVGKDSVIKDEILTLDTRLAGAFNESVLLLTEGGLVLWVENDVIMFEPEGQQRWKKTSKPHSTENRFLLYGKFNASEAQIALFSSGISSSLKVTTLGLSNGETAWSEEFQNVEVSDVALVHGKNKDFALVSLLKMKSDLKSEAIDKISDVSTTIISMLAKEDIANNASLSPTSRVSEDLAFIEVGGKFFHTIHHSETSHAESAHYRSTIKVVSNENKGKEENLSVYVLRKPRKYSSDVTSQIRRINVANWDISNKESKCNWK